MRNRFCCYGDDLVRRPGCTAFFERLPSTVTALVNDLAGFGVPVALISDHACRRVCEPLERFPDLVADFPALNNTGVNHARDEVNGVTAACKLVFPNDCRNS